MRNHMSRAKRKGGEMKIRLGQLLLVQSRRRVACDISPDLQLPPVIGHKENLRHIAAIGGDVVSRLTTFK